MKSIQTLERLQSIQTIIFDMDGVIIDSEPLHSKAGKRALDHSGIHLNLEPIQEIFKGRTDYDIFSYIVANYAPEDPNPEEQVAQLIEAKAKAFYDLLDQVPLVPDVLSFVESAKQHYGKLGLATSANRLDQQRVFDRFNLHNWFDVVIVAEDIIKAKPDPEPYQKAAQKLAISPQFCLVIEDSINGIRSAKGAGCQAIGITTSFPREELFAAGADDVIDRFDELLKDLECQDLGQLQ